MPARIALLTLLVTLLATGTADAHPRLSFTQARAEASLRSGDVLRTSDHDRITFCNRWSATEIHCGVEAISTHEHIDDLLGVVETQTSCTQTVSIKRGVKRGIYSRLADDRSCVYDS